MSKIKLRDRLDGNELDLSLSEIVDVPVKELAAVPKATHLDLSCNHIKVLPANFATLVHLVKLDLSKNEITELPHNFGNLINLQNLDLYGNHLAMLPVSFCRLKNLKWLDLKNNPLHGKLKTVAGDCLDEKQCQQCAKQVVSFLKSVQSELEREKQKRLKEEREVAAVQKAAEERELEEQRKLKKKERERRKAEQKALKEKMKQEELNKQQNEKEFYKDGISGAEKNGTLPYEKTKHKKSACSILCLLMFVFLLAALTAASVIGLHLYQGFKLNSTDDLQIAVEEAWKFTREKSFIMWEASKVYFMSTKKIALLWWDIALSSFKSFKDS